MRLLAKNKNGGTMFKQQIYTMIANEFATPIGIAEITTTAATNPMINDDGSVSNELLDTIELDLHTKSGREAYKNLNEQIRINRITLEAIKRNKYQQLTRGVFSAKRENPKWSDRRAYSHTWRALNNKSSNNNNNNNSKCQ